MRFGEVPEWPKGSDCKSDGLCLRRFESSPLHQFTALLGGSGNSSVGRARAFQARGRGFEPRFPLQFRSLKRRGRQSNEDHAHVAQPVEHFLGKEEVTGSIPVVGFLKLERVGFPTVEWAAALGKAGRAGRELGIGWGSSAMSLGS